MLLMLLELCVHVPLSSFASVWMSELLEPPASRASAFLTPTFRAEPADSCDGTCTSSRIRILRGFSTANSAPRWWTTNHHQGGIAYICLCHLYPFVIIYLLVKTKKRGWFTILFLVTNRHQPVGKGWKRMKKVQSKKLLCHHVHDPIVQLSFTDSFHLTQPPAASNQERFPHWWDGRAPSVTKSPIFPNSLLRSGCCRKFFVFKLMLFGLVNWRIICRSDLPPGQPQIWH